MPLVLAEVASVGSVFAELLEGETVTSFGVGVTAPTNPGNANDRNHATPSKLGAGFASGSIQWGWACDFGAAVSVNRMRVWDPVGADYVNDPSNLIVEWSDNGTSWTTAARTYSSATVATGLAHPFETTTTEYRYDLTGGPLSHRYWRIRQTAGGGLFSGRGISEWFVDGTATAGEAVWNDAPDTIDGNDATSDDVDVAAVTETGGPFWRGYLPAAESIGTIVAVLGMENAGDVEVALQGGDLDDFSDAATVVTLTYDATGGLAADELELLWDATTFRYWQLVLLTIAQDVRVFSVALLAGAEAPEAPEPSKAILEIYVHDEDASRWGAATWATGPATGTEGIWSAAGWTDVTPQGVNGHIIWGSRRPDRGILHQQDGATWNIETYDPDRILDPGNADSPYAPQLVAGLPIRISHDTTVIRTGYCDEIRYRYKPPWFRGQILATDTIALLNQASVPADSILGDTLLERIQDAVNAAGIAVGGIPLPPGGPAGPALSEWVEGAATDEGTPVWTIVRKACEEVLWVPYVMADAGLGLRAWGDPLERGREIAAPNLEDLESVSSEDGLYSVARVQVADPDLDPIEREAAPLPRYGRRVIDRRETTADAEGWAAAVLAERSWPGVRYVPGTIHCFSAADVDYFGSLETMERVQVTHPGAVSVSGRILGGELWVEHRAHSDRGATWMFKFAVATDGSTAIGLTTLVADGTGDTLVDDMTETDYLEAD